MNRLQDRRLIAAAARRIETAQSPSAEYADPKVRELLTTWQELTAAAEAAKAMLNAAIEKRRQFVSSGDRLFIREAKRKHPGLIVLETDGEVLPVRCMISGLAIFEDDELIGDAEAGFAVLKNAVRENVLELA